MGAEREEGTVFTLAREMAKRGGRRVRRERRPERRRVLEARPARSSRRARGTGKSSRTRSTVCACPPTGRRSAPRWKRRSRSPARPEATAAEIYVVSDFRETGDSLLAGESTGEHEPHPSPRDARIDRQREHRPGVHAAKTHPPGRGRPDRRRRDEPLPRDGPSIFRSSSRSGERERRRSSSSLSPASSATVTFVVIDGGIGNLPGGRVEDTRPAPHRRRPLPRSRGVAAGPRDAGAREKMGGARRPRRRPRPRTSSSRRP